GVPCGRDPRRGRRRLPGGEPDRDRLRSRAGDPRHRGALAVRAAAGEGRRWLALSHVYGLSSALIVGYLLVGIPMQVYDCLSDLVSLAAPFKQALIDALTLPGYLRVWRYLEFKLVYELAQGHYNTAF